MLQKHITVLKYSKERRICGLQNVINRIYVRKFSSYEKQDIMVTFTMIKEEFSFQQDLYLSMYKRVSIYAFTHKWVLYMYTLQKYINIHD